MGKIEDLYNLRQKSNRRIPFIGILYTITPDTYLSLEEFFPSDLNLDYIHSVTFQIELYITEEMANDYADFLKNSFGIGSDRYWKGCVRDIKDFESIDMVELTKQVNTVDQKLKRLGNVCKLEPITYTPENIGAYFGAKWNEMTDNFNGCRMPWGGVDITATGNVAACHIYYDLIMGNLYDNRFDEI